MLDHLYRALLRLLPPEFDGVDRDEMWDTYQTRIKRATGVRTPSRERIREMMDLIGVIVRSLSPPLPSTRSGKTRGSESGLYCTRRCLPFRSPGRPHSISVARNPRSHP